MNMASVGGSKGDRGQRLMVRDPGNDPSVAIEGQSQHLKNLSFK